MSVTVPRHDVVMTHKAEAARRLVRLSRWVGTGAVFVGEQASGSPATAPLYPERIGCGCRVVSLNETEERCPLVVEWGSRQRGICEPEWLMEVAG
ncbi:MAG TPA: hypothetical protein DCQ64_25405 [Candidatus Rokubacteria bacterium]|nr:hypothetical protein [Candidatus Rokubacteria bacterium]